MIKNLVFDLDGTLVELKDAHFISLNLALEAIHPSYVISREDHETRFNGLTTNTKLQMLHEERGLPQGLFHQIWLDKQQRTAQVIQDELQPIYRVTKTLENFYDKGYFIAVVSNSIRETIQAALNKAELGKYVTAFYGNEDASPKPSSDLYLKCVRDNDLQFQETLIIEDSPVGIEAANKTGCVVMKVKSPYDITVENIMRVINAK